MKKNKFLYTKQIKKTKLSSTIKNSALLACFFIAIAIVTIWFVKNLIYFIAIDSSKFFYTFVASAVCLIVIITALTLVDKITHKKWIYSIDFIGKYTLYFFDICTTKIRSFCGIEIIKNNHRVSRKKYPKQKIQSTPLSTSTVLDSNDGLKNNTIITPTQTPVNSSLASNNNDVALDIAPTKPIIASTNHPILHPASGLKDQLSDNSISTNPNDQNTLTSTLELEASPIISAEDKNEPNTIHLENIESIDLRTDKVEVERDKQHPDVSGTSFVDQVNQSIEQIKSTYSLEDKPTEPAINAQENSRSKESLPHFISSYFSQPTPKSESETTAPTVPQPPTKESLFFIPTQPNPYQLPSTDLLEKRVHSTQGYSEEELFELSRSVERVLKDYKIEAEVVGAYPGPIITRFELNLAAGIKVSRVNSLSKDLARTLLVSRVRVVEIIEGTSFIGLEIPNKQREMVSFHEIISSDVFQQAKSSLTLALGKDVSGNTVVSDLGKMPHLLVAGTTGSGKSVAINTMILSMLYKATPEQVRMIMIDPKMLELSVYEDIPHLLSPVVTDMNEAQNALRWAVAEMERRYKLMSKMGVRNLAGFNQLIKNAENKGEMLLDPLYIPVNDEISPPNLTRLPHIVIIIDELADMMMIVGKKVEELIARLAQKARAAGIHLILATQRPSVDVLTGLIKANVPSRISFQVSSRIDSTTILGQGGAENLLGNGDMLFSLAGSSFPQRAHGAFVDDHEVHRIVDHLKSFGSAHYLSEITKEPVSEASDKPENKADEKDALYGDAVDFVTESNKASISSVQRRFKIGYNRAANIIDQMERDNIVSQPEGNGSRRIIQDE